MAQVIIYTNSNGGVSVCIPTGELPIDEVLAKDCPAGSIIVNVADLPTDNEFFNAWELVDGKVTINEVKKQAIFNKVQDEVFAKQSALTKLTSLGISKNELKALIG